MISRHRLVSVVAVLAAALLPACDRLPGRPDEADRYVRPDRVLDPVALYAANCSGCHGEPGRAGPARDLGDPLYLAVIGRDELRSATADGVEGTAMPAFVASEGGWLSDAQIDALVVGIYTRWASEEVPMPSELPPYSEADSRKRGIGEGDPARGKLTFASYCASCHGIDGKSGAGGAVTDGSYLALTSDQALRSAVIAGRPEFHMPAWNGYEARPALGFQEISDVTAWLVAQRQKYPGKPYQAEAAAAK